MRDQVLVVVGVGGMGEAIARRSGSGRHVLLADFNAPHLKAVAERLTGDGFTVTAREVDVSSRESVAALADHAAALGDVVGVAHTAGLSPAQAPVSAILAVDLVGVAFSLEEFGRVIAPGGAGVVIASMSGIIIAGSISAEDEAAFATSPAEDLRDLPIFQPDAMTDPGKAYGMSKRANHLRVQAASITWGRRGARLNSVSPGIISTPMGRNELEEESGARMRAMIDGSALQRLGTPDDIASAVAFLLGPDAAFVSGIDLLVDGGEVAGITAARR